MLVSNGDGTFQDEEIIDVSRSNAVAVIDLDSDGLADILTPREVLLSNGDGTFSDPMALPVSMGSAFTTADLDGDGTLDIAFSESGFGVADVSVLLGNGDGAFELQPDTFDVGFAPTLIDAADLDGDGIADLAVAGSSAVAILLGRGNGSFDTGVDVPAGPASSADLDGDGALDLAIVNETSDSVSVVRNRGDGTFADAVEYAVGNSPGSLVIRDLDADGHPDLAVANSSSNDPSVLLGKGDGTFADAVSYAVGDRPESLAAGDLDGDGALDLVTRNLLSDDVSVLIGRGDGTFTDAVSVPVGDSLRSLVARDLDGDGDLDLAVGTGSVFGPGRVIILRNEGDGTFAETGRLPVGDFPHAATAVDLDGDGDPDLVTANRSSDDLSVLMNNGDGTFTGAVNHDVGTRPESLVTRDLDGDGDQDLIALSRFSDSISVLLNNADGTFADAVLYDAGNSPQFLAATDLDGDGRVELIVNSSSSLEGLSVLPGHGDGTFGVRRRYTQIDRGPVTAADLDGNGAADLVAGGRVLFGMGTGEFQPPFTPPLDSGRLFVQGLSLADVDLDGTPDLVATDTAMQGVRIYVGNGNGTFQAERRFLFPSQVPAAVADLNGNGAPDILGTGDGFLSVLLRREPDEIEFEIADGILTGELGDLPDDGSVQVIVEAIVTDEAADEITTEFEVSSSALDPDPDNNRASETIAVAPRNEPPIADAGGPYTIEEGDPLTLNASGSSDPDGDPLSFTWDVSGDGTFGDATGEAPMLSWSELNALGIGDDGTFSVAVRVDDGAETGTDTTTLTVANVAPPDHWTQY